MPLRHKKTALTIVGLLLALFTASPLVGQSGLVARARAVHTRNLMTRYPTAVAARPARSTAPTVFQIDGLDAGSAGRSLWQGAVRQDFDSRVGLIGGYSRRRSNGFLGLLIRF